MGYRGVEENILEQSEIPSIAIDLNVLLVDARKNQEGVIGNKQVQEVLNHVVSYPKRKCKFVVDLGYCKLFLDIPCTRVVSIGTVHNTRDAMLHHARIPPNHVRVAIDIEIEDDALLSIPLDEDIIILGGAICTFVAWPVHIVDVVLTKGKVIAEHNATSPPRVEHASRKTKVVKSKHKVNKSRSKSSNKERKGTWSPRIPTTMHS
ncbi:hypothetical protein Lal_00031473 [Lupinus albus]|nr:hypothetical protein Lal_00031473 [Lupinus albus]